MTRRRKVTWTTEPAEFDEIEKEVAVPELFYFVNSAWVLLLSLKCDVIVVNKLIGLGVCLSSYSSHYQKSSVVLFFSFSLDSSSFHQSQFAAQC